MSVYKDKWIGYNGATWRVACYYTDWTGERKKHEKRGFKTRKEARAYEAEFLAKKSRDINMSFSSFIDVYMGDIRPQIKLSTYTTKENIIETHIRPYFMEKSLSDISSTDILQWQNMLLGQRDAEGKGYSPTYLRTIQNQMNAIFNHAVKYYDLAKNPCLKNKKMGKEKGKEMLFWTKDEYLKFSEKMKNKPVSYYAFQLLYWTGIRCGELLALTRADFDFENHVLSISKTFQVIHGKAMITPPKTEKSNRKIELPDFLCKEMEDYISSLYKLDDDSRLFEVTKYYLHHEMDRGCKAAGVKRIRIHDLWHSSCALLISLGYSPVEIADRLGHESVTITERYAHLYPSVQKDMAAKLDETFKEASTTRQKRNFKRKPGRMGFIISQAKDRDKGTMIMRYRIEYADGRCCNFANGRKDLLEWLKLLQDETITDIRKVYKSGATDSVMETYKPYINKRSGD